MTTAAIRERLQEYIRTAEDKKVEASYTMMETEIKSDYDYWNDAAFIAELDRRSADYKSGKVASISWEQAKARFN